MQFDKFARASVYLMLGCILGSVGAYADEDLPSVHTLPCETACANSTGAVGVAQRLPSWPHEFLDLTDYVEGYVRLHYKINTDGRVSDISVVSTVGPKEFEDRTVNAVKDWVYKPATLDGKPVMTCRTMVMTFKMRGIVGGRSEIVQAYRTALSEVKEEKWEEAQTILTEALSKPKLNLYERGMLANISSLVALNKKDYLEAHRLSTEALTFSSEDVPAGVRQNLLQTRIQSASMLGDIVDALDATDKLKSMREFDPSDPTVKFVETAKSRADGMPIFVTTAKIPEAEVGQVSFLGLYRRNFAFQDIKGSLSGFTLNCKQQAIESKVSETAEWHVPKSWSECRVLVRGTPGTTFKLAQLTE